MRSGEIKPEKAKEEVLERGLKHVEYKGRYHPLFPILTIIGIILCFLPLGAELTGLNALGFLTQLSSIDFPIIVKVLALGLLASLVVVSRYAIRVRRARGGTGDKHETIMLVKEGPYAILRHPEELPWAYSFPYSRSSSVD
ncbi:hypothetical protein AKJ42_00690 [candidate division MSBL1 archaeon SCGC-AAA261C02]|uniref:Uncharacterized protein n=1 Tax=candidate division MSBL1 archaeon SCGC-AAA261C02 TaxID=1698272 RepID=A0A133V1X5_9EURY|nr:hypothetical protein AKJ42_00690 [candidate division MSBL1 archaeon SCGC-AAA261C02]